MDAKTLEYMGTRVDKARKIMQRIAERTKEIQQLEDAKKQSSCLKIDMGSHLFWIRFTPECADKIFAAIATVLLEEVNKLQAELDQL